MVTLWQMRREDHRTERIAATRLPSSVVAPPLLCDAWVDVLVMTEPCRQPARHDKHNTPCVTLAVPHIMKPATQAKGVAPALLDPGAGFATQGSG
jgi:hypothetical protein